jgi:hypothetical protein
VTKLPPARRPMHLVSYSRPNVTPPWTGSALCHVVVVRFSQDATRADALPDYCRMLTARAATSSTVMSEVSDCAIINILTRVVIGIVSVGLSAVEFVYDRYT